MTATIKNGQWVDDGRPVGQTDQTCPRCSRRTFNQTTSVDSCSSCGYFYNYWTHESRNTDLPERAPDKEDNDDWYLGPLE